jgi:Tol biopolymer transport system component
MIPKVALGAFLAVVMVVVGVGTYLYIGTRQSRVATPAQLPTAAQPTPHAFQLPGTLVLSQDGGLFALSYGRFHEITPLSGWMQPSFMPDGNLLVIKRSGFYSDVYMISRLGHPLRQLTNDAAPPRSYDTGDNHWAFYPRMTPDGRTVFLSYDSPKSGYEVDLSVWAMPTGGGIRQGRVWTDEYDAPGYTGGDLQPIPVPGGLVYTRYDRNYDGSIISQVWYTSVPGAFGHALTSPGEDCREPSFTADYSYIAMICTFGQQTSDLVIAPYAGHGIIGARRPIITNQMVAQPTWAPDGSGIAYLAPAAAAAPFQLWFLPRLAYFQPPPSPAPSPSAHASASASPSSPPSPAPSPSPVVVNPIQITTNNGFDATSTLAWAS